MAEIAKSQLFVYFSTLHQLILSQLSNMHRYGYQITEIFGAEFISGVENEKNLKIGRKMANS